MKSSTLLRLLLLLLLPFTSCDKEDENEQETKKGFLTAHTWRYERVSYNGSVNLVNSFPDDRFTFNKDGTYSKTTSTNDGGRSRHEGRWELNADATQLTFMQEGMRQQAPVRELTANTLKFKRNDAPDIVLEFDMIPE